jgi:hypothetical protein
MKCHVKLRRVFEPDYDFAEMQHLEELPPLGSMIKVVWNGKPLDAVVASIQGLPPGTSGAFVIQADEIWG